MDKRCSSCKNPLDSQTGRDTYCLACRKAYNLFYSRNVIQKRDFPASTTPKICEDCNREMDASKFGRNRRNEDGLSVTCAKCRSDLYFLKKEIKS